MKTAITLVVVALAIFLLSAWYTAEEATTTPDGTDTSPTSTSTADSLERYSDTVEEVVDFSLDYPSEATVSQVSDTIYEIKYIGPDSAPNTEITDGYYLSLQFLADSYQSVLAEAEPVGAVGSNTLGGYRVTTYDAQSALGSPVDHTVVDLGPYVLDIAVTISGRDTAEYQREVDQIIDSLSFTIDQEVPEDVQAQIDAMGDQIRVATPEPQATVSTPIQISGEARGTWFFEATAPVVVTNWDGLIIGEGYIEATGNWMTESFVPFTGEVTYTREANPVYDRGILIFQKANPSGLPANDAALEIPILFE